MSFPHQVVEFNAKVLKISQRPKGMLAEAEFQISEKCLNEEITEFVDAHKAGDVIGCVDAMIDLMYFANGVLYKMGLTPEEIVQCKTAVHEANMEKKLGVNHRRGDGSAADAIKPADWISPEERIIDILDGKA